MTVIVTTIRSYLLIINSSYFCWLTFGAPLVPNSMVSSYHRYLAYIGIGACHYSFYIACKTSPGVITAETVDCFDCQEYDGVIYSEGFCCRTCNTTKVRSIRMKRVTENVVIMKIHVKRQYLILITRSPSSPFNFFNIVFPFSRDELFSYVVLFLRTLCNFFNLVFSHLLSLGRLSYLIYSFSFHLLTSSLILSYLILSYLILSYLILSYLILSYIFSSLSSSFTLPNRFRDRNIAVYAIIVSLHSITIVYGSINVLVN